MTSYLFRSAAAVFMLGASVAVPTAALETGDLEALRMEALEQVNIAREEQGLPPLELTQALNDAAQAHAVDMIEDDYYSHVAPDGTAPMDRFVASGGSQWRVVRENIARCSNCAVPPTTERVEAFQDGWMNSPGHRENILAEGLDSFGFGIAGEGDAVFAVQNFAGPGMPRGLPTGESPVPVAPDDSSQVMVEAVNEARQREGKQPLEASAALVDAAGQLLPQSLDSEDIIGAQEPLFELLSAEARQSFSQLQVLAGSCGGCGAEPTRQDVYDFVDQWLDNPQYGDTLLAGAATAVGFAMRANGEGRKVAIAVVGNR